MSRELKVGDRVLIARKSWESGYYWNAENMDPLVGHTGLVISVSLAKPVTYCVADWWFLRDSLELQEATPDTVKAIESIPQSLRQWIQFIRNGGKLKFRSGCDVKFVAFENDAKPHCKLVLLNPATGNIVTRYASGKSSTEPYDEPGDILVS